MTINLDAYISYCTNDLTNVSFAYADMMSNIAYGTGVLNVLEKFMLRAGVSTQERYRSIILMNVSDSFESSLRNALISIMSSYYDRHTSEMWAKYNSYTEYTRDGMKEITVDI